MGGSVGPCAFQPCRQRAAVTVRLVVDGEDLVLPVCHAHAEWLGVYAEEDVAMRLLDLFPEEESARPLDDAPGTQT